MGEDWQHGFYRRSLSERQARLVQGKQLNQTALEQLQANETTQHDLVVENYITDYRLPEGVALGLVVNGKAYTVPMATEEPSVIAAASNGAKRVAQSGGFTAEVKEHYLVGQVVLTDVENPDRVTTDLLMHQDELLQVANDAHPSMKKRGGGAKQLRIRQVGDFISVDLLIDVQQAMGANTVNTMAEAVAQNLRQSGYHVLTAILSNLADQSLVTVTCHVDFKALVTPAFDGASVAERIAKLSELAQVDPYRAATHNKGIMNGIDAAVLASGNDWRAIESGAHAYAARSGQYRGLATWTLMGEQLIGGLTMPMPVGVVGGSIKLTPQSRVNYQISEIQTAQELAGVIASLGLAQNLAALRALATSGIQAGHMKLQYRSLAMSVGAIATEVAPLVSQLKQYKHVDATLAQKILREMRTQHGTN